MSPRLAIASLLLLLVAVQADVKSFDTMLYPDESTIHYMDGYIRGPGYIELGELTFVTSGIDIVPESGDYTDDGFGRYNDDGGNRRLDGGIDTDGTSVDIAIFHVPEKCANSNKEIDKCFTDLGIGNTTADGQLRFCCSNEAIELGLCERTNEHFGRLIYDYSKYAGDSKFISIPSQGDVSRRIRQSKIDEEGSGHYVVLMANCDEVGRIVAVEGSVVWRSDHGYLPGELFGIMYFYWALLAAYFGMALWYGISMLLNRDSRIPIEKWILLTMLLGLVELFFQVNDFVTWNETGFQRRILSYISILAGSLKHGISRCLAVMVALGWGVVRDSLGSTMRTILVLGTIYTALSVAVDLLVFFAIADYQTLSQGEENSIIDVASVLSFAIVGLEVIFFMWMLDAMNNTMEYLENMNQTRKLKRYLQLRTIVLFTLLAAVIWAVFSVVDTYGETGILLEENQWVVDAARETIFLLALLGVAILWRPNPNAKEYAYVMELPALGADGENDLELTGVVPSAMDDDDDDEAPGKFTKGYSDEPFQIDSAEAS